MTCDAPLRQPCPLHAPVGDAAAVVRRAAPRLLLGAGLYLALFVAPPDYQQGEAVRIMYVHVPAAWMASFVYALHGAGERQSR